MTGREKPCHAKKSHLYSIHAYEYGRLPLNTSGVVTVAHSVNDMKFIFLKEAIFVVFHVVEYDAPAVVESRMVFLSL